MSDPDLGPIGLARPDGVLDRERSLEVARRLSPASVSDAILRRLHDRSGIDRRHVAVLAPDGSLPLYGIDVRGDRDDSPFPTTARRMRTYRDAASPLATAAARAALERSDVSPEAITHVVTASCTGFAAPGVDLALIEALDLAPNVRRSHLGFMGCHAAVNALAVAEGYARADPRARVLVVCVEISSVHFHHDDRLDHVISNILFADGAGGVVVGQGLPRPIGRVAATGSMVFPGSGDAMAWHVGDHGFDMTLDADVPKLIASGLPGWLSTWIDDRLDTIGGWAIHPGGPKVIDAVVEALGLAPDAASASRAILRDFGNMSSVTLLHILDRLHAEEIDRPWVGLAFGPGLAGESILVR